MTASVLEAFNRIMVLAPHADDGELGCGGTISRLVNLGKEVHYVAFSICEESVPSHLPRNVLEQELKNATGTLGIRLDRVHVHNHRVRNFTSSRQEILDELVRFNDSVRPDLVFCPCSFDIHQDHQVISQEAKRAFKHTTLLGYELIWNNLESSCNCFIKLSEEELSQKIKALQCYQSQQGRNYLQEHLIRSCASCRGLQARVRYAEAFEVIRWMAV